MAYFKNLQAGTVLEVTKKADIEQYRKHTERYIETDKDGKKVGAPKEPKTGGKPETDKDGK